MFFMLVHLSAHTRPRLFTHDEGACWAPKEVYANSTILAHYGLMPLGSAAIGAAPADGGTTAHVGVHTHWRPASMTTRREFNYSMDVADPSEPRMADGWTRLTRGHACHEPSKDLVIPAFRCAAGPQGQERAVSSACPNKFAPRQAC